MLIFHWQSSQGGGVMQSKLVRPRPLSWESEGKS